MRLRFSRQAPSPGLSSGTSIPSCWASLRTASGKGRLSISITKRMGPPPLPQPKQWKICLDSLTEKEGVFSWWNGHSPQ